jgi:hypothetical protein
MQNCLSNKMYTKKVWTNKCFQKNLHASKDRLFRYKKFSKSLLHKYIPFFNQLKITAF